MAITSIGFKSPRPKDGTGNFVNEGVDIPRMLGHKNADPRWMIKQLAEALDSLAYGHCTFWACKGPNKPRSMVTCNKCWAMRQIANVKRTIERQQEAT